MAKVFIICTGVGHINRGYESFTTECFANLKDVPEFDLFLLKGGGYSMGREIKIPCIKRNSKYAFLLTKFFRKDAYWIEQFSFFLLMLPSLIKHKPTVLYYSDFVLGTFLWHLRRFTNFKYKLLFSNGAPNGPPYKTEDHVQQLLPIYEKQAIEQGVNSQMQTLLPYGFDINIDERIKLLSNRQILKNQLGLPSDKKILLSVGAINKYHKRMDYLINEVAELSDNYFLVILGQFESDTVDIIDLANKKLPNRHLITNLPFEEVKHYYVTADYFVLASLVEGFGRVIIEALSYGLPCILNDYVNAREVLKEYGNYVDMTKNGILQDVILQVDNSKISKTILIDFAYQNYSWNKLSPRYIKMICYLF